jgi:ABC-type dipeptide/oligopeptide/nickel transport system permease subunit
MHKRNWGLIVGGTYLVLLVLFAIFGPSIRNAQLSGIAKSVDSDIRVYNAVLDPVSSSPFQPAGGPVTLGTDELRRDVVARLAEGARVSLTVGLTVQAIALLVGITVGVLGVLAPKWLRNPLMRFTDGMFAFPDILLAILIVSVVGLGMVPVIVALSVTAWPSIARLVASQVATLKDREYVVAAKAAGASNFYLVTRHILPQIIGILLAYSMIDLAGTILAESTLSFLGIGVQEPQPSWGSMINQARLNMNSYPILLVWPCLVLSLTIFSLNFVGDGLRNLADPRERSG